MDTVFGKVHGKRQDEACWQCSFSSFRKPLSHTHTSLHTFANQFQAKKDLPPLPGAWSLCSLRASVWLHLRPVHSMHPGQGGSALGLRHSPISPSVLRGGHGSASPPDTYKQTIGLWIQAFLVLFHAAALGQEEAPSCFNQSSPRCSLSHRVLTCGSAAPGPEVWKSSGRQVGSQLMEHRRPQSVDK